jgi:hypothetical protein
MASVQNVLENLQIPADFARYDSVTDAQVIAGLELWKTNAQGTLLRLHELVRERLEAGDPLSAQERSRIVSTVAAFDGDGQWITEVARESCKGDCCWPLAVDDADVFQVYSVVYAMGVQMLLTTY